MTAANGILRKLLVAGHVRWAWGDSSDGYDVGASIRLLPPGTTFASVVAGGPGTLTSAIDAAEPWDGAAGDITVLAPVDDDTEVWAAGVTYERSRQARMAESSEPDIYDRIYDAQRPELFFKSVGWRVRGPGQSVSVRADSTWDVPEPELAAVLAPDRTVVGWTICNDMSSRSIEGDNPLYLPQAKIYFGGCALGPGIVPAAAVADPYSLDMRLTIDRAGECVWQGETNTGQLRRRVEELASYLFAADIFPRGVVLSTGTSLVPEESFTVRAGDRVRIEIDGVGVLSNPVVSGMPDDAPVRG